MWCHQVWGEVRGDRRASIGQVLSKGRVWGSSTPQLWWNSPCMLPGLSVFHLVIFCFPHIASSVLLLSGCLQAGSFHFARMSQSKFCSQTRAVGSCPFLPHTGCTALVLLGALWFVPAAGASPARGRKRYLCSKTVLSLAAGTHSTKEAAAIPFPDVTLHCDTVAHWVQPERALILVSPSRRLLHPALQKTSR